MNRKRLLSILAVTMMLLTTAFGGLLGVAQAQDDRPTLRFGVNAADLQFLDPHFASGTQDRTVVDMIFNGLVRYVPGNSAEMEPDLATEIPEPTMEGESQVWTFTLRDDVMCHDNGAGEPYPLTAEDVVYSLEKVADPERSAYSANYAGMTFEAVDDATVSITLETPQSATLFLPNVANYAGGYIVCSQAVEALGDDGFTTNPVGTGPFMFESYTPLTSVQLVANDDYFRGAPQLAGVDVQFNADPTSREFALQAGELDVIAGLPEAQWVDRVNQQEGVVADVFGVGEVVFVNFDITVEPLNDPLVREAIALAISRDEHLALSGAPVAENVYSVVPASLMPGGLTQEQAEEAGVLYQQDLERAQELLTEAGYADGFELDLITSEMDSYRRNYEVLQSELEQIGITVNLSVVDHATMHAQIREDVNPIVIYVAFRPNADVYFTQFFSTAAIEGTTNFSNYDQIDDLIEQARAATDPAEQEELWRQANIQILEDLAAYPLHYVNQVYARSETVDYGHELISALQLYPQITELTTISQ